MEMNQQQQVSNNPLPSTDVPLKRKRGRPRKDQSQNPGGSTYVSPKKHQSQNCGITDHKDSKVGLEVRGVVASEFGAGYVLSVRIGQSRTRYTGMVLKPEMCLPGLNYDEPPGFETDRRIEVPLTSENLGHQQHQEREKRKSDGEQRAERAERAESQHQDIKNPEKLSEKPEILSADENPGLKKA